MKITKLVNLGIEEFSKGNFEESLRIYKKAFNYEDLNNYQRGIIYRNMGLSHYSLKKYEQAEKCFLRSIENGNDQANWELCLSRLHQGNIKGIELFSYRYYVSYAFPDIPLKKITTINQLKNTDNILVLNEQGFGDEILFSRGLRLLEGKNFSYQIYPQMITLFKSNYDFNFFEDRVLSIEFVKKHDAWIPSGDLFKFQMMQNGYDFLPFKSGQPKKKKAGICFFSSNTLSVGLVNESRKIDYDELKKIVTKYDYEWINLQKDFFMDFAVNHEIGPFKDTAELIKDLDFVLTIDTVVAHLASIMGKKVIIMYRNYIDWRWKLPLYSNEVIITDFADLENVLSQMS